MRRRGYGRGGKGAVDPQSGESVQPVRETQGQSQGAALVQGELTAGSEQEQGETNEGGGGQRGGIGDDV